MNDLYAPDFPHATKKGYDLGCHGAGCPGAIEHGMSCTQVHRRHSGDYAFAKKLDAGMSVGDILAAERQAASAESNWETTVVAAAQSHTMVGKDADGELCSCGVRAVSLIEHIAQSTLEAAGVHAPTVATEPAKPKAPAAKTAPSPHGTTTGYQKGCHDGTQCPRHPETGKTCREAYQEYQREYAARRRANGGPLKNSASPVVTPAPKPVEAPRPTPKPPAASRNLELDEARAEISRLQAEIAELRATPTPAVVTAADPQAQQTQLTLSDGLTLTVAITVGRAA
jgi:hypothetical protein